MVRLLESRSVAGVNRSEQLQFTGKTFSAFAKSIATSDSSTTSHRGDAQYSIESSNSLGSVYVNVSGELMMRF